MYVCVVTMCVCIYEFLLIKFYNIILITFTGGVTLIGSGICQIMMINTQVIKNVVVFCILLYSLCNDHAHDQDSY